MIFKVWQKTDIESIDDLWLQNDTWAKTKGF